MTKPCFYFLGVRVFDWLSKSAETDHSALVGRKMLLRRSPGNGKISAGLHFTTYCIDICKQRGEII
jgi:hypothetical protein